MDYIAARCWGTAISRARLPRPISGRDIKFSLKKTFFFINAAKQMVFSQDHVFLKRLEERIPSPILWVLRKFVVNS
jgi:hypothetical protein